MPSLVTPCARDFLNARRHNAGEDVAGAFFRPFNWNSRRVFSYASEERTTEDVRKIGYRLKIVWPNRLGHESH